jgi:diguanylate cyclase (GGDEF)-like protein
VSVVNVGTSETFPRPMEVKETRKPRAAKTRRRPKPAPGDELTGLATRSGFLARLQRSVAPDWCIEGLFVLLLDVDRFREMNDRLGYKGGDQLLIEVAARLKGRLRPTDTVSRFGADEFAVLLAGVPSGRDVARVAERLLGELEAPLDIEGRQVKAAASIGVAMGTAGERPEDVIRNAERALSRAKLLGRSNYQIFRTDTASRETSLQEVETALRRALDQEEFRSRFRPTVRRKEGSVASFEVVLWRRTPAGSEESLRPVGGEVGG